MFRTSHLVCIACLSAATVLPSHATAQDQELAAENYRQADVNGDGLLVLAEFTSFIDLNAEDGLGRAAQIKKRGMHARAFDRVDANGDGVVSPEELRKIRK